MANTVSATLLFLGVVAQFIHDENVDHVCGPVRYRVQAQQALHPPADWCIAPASPKALVQIAYAKLRVWHAPSPFLQADGQGLVKPELLIRAFLISTPQN